MKTYEIIQHSDHWCRFPFRTLITKVEAEDERHALCLFLMSRPEVGKAILSRPEGKYELACLGNNGHEYFVAEESSPRFETTHEVTNAMKEKILFNTK